MMTQSEFTAFYPQFAGFTPAVVMTAYIAQANGRFSSFTEADAAEARRLYTAHKLTMYACAALPACEGEELTTAGGGNNASSEVTGNEQSPLWGAAMTDGAGTRPTYAQIAAAGRAQQRAASKKVGEVSVTYAAGTSSAAAATGLADLAETVYGLQLLSLIRQYSRGVYVP